MTQEKMRAETERDEDDCSCHARALDYGETTLPRATCTDALRQHGKRELDKFPILRRSLGSCYLVPNETINDRDHRKSGDTSHLFPIETVARKDRRNEGEWKREKRQAPFARTRPSSVRLGSVAAAATTNLLCT